MTRDTDKDWETVALTEPYWGVISDDKFLGESLNTESEQLFFKSGQDYVHKLLEDINYLLGHSPQTIKALDFGCGVGRLLLPLAARYKHVVGVDASPEMLRLCQENAGIQGIGNITLVDSAAQFDGLSGDFDLVNSYIVIQHIPTERGYSYIESLIRKTRVGGVCSLQVTYAKSRRHFNHEQPKARFFRREGNLVHDIMPTQHTPPQGTITMFDYDLNTVFAIVNRYSSTNLMVIPSSDDDHLGVHLIFQRTQ